jgi:hypothetical protein
VALALLHTALWCVICHACQLAADENGPVENSQTLFLGIASLVYLSTAVLSTGLERMLFAGLALLAVSLLLREVDVRGLDLNPVVASMVNGLGRNLLLGSMWLALLIACALRARRLLTVFLAWVKTPAGNAIVLAGALLVLGRPFDGKVFGLPVSTAQLCEELLEVNGYMLVLLSSILGLRSAVKRRRAARRVEETGVPGRADGA